MKEMACTKCQWQGDSHWVIVGNDGSELCPQCQSKVVSVRELRDIRIEEKLDKIIALLVTIGVEKAISKGKELIEGDELVWFCPDCKKHHEVGTPCPYCGKPTIEEISTVSEYGPMEI